MSIEEIKNYLALEKRVFALSVNEVVKVFEDYTQQKIPKEAVQYFALCGLSPVDLLTSNLLNKYGIKNLLQFEAEKTDSD